MSRKKQAPVRDVLADPVFNSKLITKAINSVMLDGKKTTAQNILYSSFKLVEEKTQKDALEVFQQAVKNVTPLTEVRSRRIGGTNYQVPMEVRLKRQQTLALRWLILFARKRNEKTMVVRLANEIIDAYNKTGGAFKKKEDTHKMAEANRAFAHFKW
ncbi:30S ribosomal protein S7 [Mesomycoplasma ovipneumoniae]|uniref:30S ribosomal protein S7 n=1 Tax=Mesomycoplasma ovipneumoniae TaxID=29562 RepID=UPI00207A9130|nr:30S ribosomal protein S7 [Mesomycoplasma ovipneumoniae]MCN0158201.1 30S ribosomal protein S7 [Mesomycoplasma ovipneumoniae]MDW2926454.1 30S ribosomal protein S7 [Mesomycoplasma ovipneumoniae]WNM16758.1 30S ribosomal protein S7 [Mesomycoplasma ovipneumoniae]